MKYSQWIGVAAAIVLVIACFLPWTFHPDLNKNFTGFFSQDNIYGKPGNTFIVLSIIASAFFLIPRIWAKRWNIFFCAIVLSYAIKSFIVFSGCYKGICPDKKAGLWIMLLASALMLLMTLFPDIKLKEEEEGKKVQGQEA
jgi:hypothetical protein